MNMDIKKRFTAAALLLGCAVLFLSPAETEAQKRGSDGVIRLEETVIEGRVAKPNAFFINTRQAMVYDTMTIKESFVKEIPASVRKGPF